MDSAEPDSVYSQPMPWIGIYITAASVACALAMSADFISGLYHRNFWFPCRYFSLNATTLTLLSIATKLPVDLNTAMPRAADQFTKLSGTVLLCTAMGNMMPSLGAMEDSEVILNVVPLGILVITIIVNVCIQIGTGLIQRDLRVEHIIILSLLLIMLLIFACSALTVPTTRLQLKQKYKQKHQQATRAVGERLPTVAELKNDMRKYWIMAHSCNPQYVLCRSATCTASGVLCLFGLLVLAYTWFYPSSWFYQSDRASVSVHPGEYALYGSESDYKWSMTYVLYSQVLAILVGILAPAWRWVNLFKSLQIPTWNHFKVEAYWKQTLVEWKKHHLSFNIGNRYSRKIVNSLRNIILDICIVLQIVVVLLCKSIRFASIFIAEILHKLLFCFRYPANMVFCCPFYITLKILRLTIKFCRRSSHEEEEPSAAADKDIIQSVLYLEGEEGLVKMIMKHGSVNTGKWIRRGRKKQLTHLIDLLKRARASEGFKGVGEYDSDRVPSIVSEEPPNCWALPLVTLTSIAIAITHNDEGLINSLLLGLNEGLRHVRLVEKKLDAKGLVHISNVADIIWDQVNLYHQWLDVDLHVLANQVQDTKKIIEHLQQVGKRCGRQFGKKSSMLTDIATEWPTKVLAGNSMYRITQTILEDYDSKFGCADKLLEWLHVTIADILGDCLTNLRSAIYMACFGSAIEAKEESIQEVAYLLGEAENILEVIGHQAVQDPGV